MSKDRNDEMIGAVMVCGAGIAGIQAALDLANSGFKVYLIENSPSIGGKMAQLDKTFPTGDCATCILSPKLVECMRNLNIEIITQAQVEELQGEPGRFRAKIRQKARYVDVSKCNACGDCEKVCPVRVPDDFNCGLSTTTAIHKVSPQAVPNAYVIEKRRKAPCVSACPIGQNAQAYVALIVQGKFAEAAEIIRRDNPLPLICGYVCHRPCESACQQGRYGESLSIRALKRFALEQSPAKGNGNAKQLGESKAEADGKIAIVGSGPAGLAAADWLVRKGYKVTIFEALPVPGGMMRVGIPDFRLPRNVLEAEINQILDLGVELKCNVEVGRDISINDLFSDGYKCVFVAVGAQKSAGLGIDGENLTGVRPGIEFIRKVNLGETVQIGERVMVIGAGNAAMDIARTAIRLGAKEVTILYRRTKKEMPADPVEVDEAISEGVKFIFLTNPKRFIGKDGKLIGIECLKMKLSEEKDASGRGRPEPIEGSEHIIECDEAILATGQVPDLGFCEDLALQTNKWGLLSVDPITLATNVPGVFAGGDVVAGAGTLSEAVAAGQRAAESIHRYIQGQDLADGREPESRSWTEEEYFELEELHRRQGRKQKSTRIMPEHNKTYTPEQAMAEAKRCLACAVCCECMECVKACQPKAIDHEMQDSVREINVGAVILAPGYEEFDARLRGEFGFGRYPNVVNNIQFERILSASGPFRGHIIRPYDGHEVKKLAFIQCVGSRDVVKGNPYCSSVCCMAAIKEAVGAKAHTPDIEVSIFYTDMRAFGKDFDRYYERAKALGVRFIRSQVSRLVDIPQTHDLRLNYIENGKPVDEVFDMVVLSTGIRPSQAALDLAKSAGVELSECGFCATDDYAPILTSRPGVLVAGAFQEPKDIPETVVQGSAAAAAAMEILASSRGSMIVEKKYPRERDVSDEPPRIGVFVCNCGINIASVVDVEKVVETAKNMPGVEYAEAQMYACADNTQERIKEIIAKHRLNRLVVASCTPRTHEALFRETVRECGLNPFLVDMANIRDQCSWVHSNNPTAATEKAIDLLRMAVGRASRLRPLLTEELPVVQSALVLGGGPSGMTTALSLAKQGFQVHLVEKCAELGGRLKSSNNRELLEKLVSAATSHPLISVYTESRLAKLEGHIGNFKSELNTPSGVKMVSHGVLIIATGGIEYVPKEYCYGEDSRIITQRELQMALHKDALNLPENPSIAMIQCVGSRTEERPFCSRFCCTEAVKNAILLKEKYPSASIVVLYRDMRTYGTNELLYQKARELGVVFVKYEPENAPQVSVSSGKPVVLSFIEPELGIKVSQEVDLLVLSVGISPATDNKEISKMAKVPLNEDGFFHEAHVKLRPVDFASEGIFLAGSAHSPKTTAENIQQALAAAGRAATILSKPTMVVGGQVSVVDVRKCVSCLTCVRICPYGAPAVSPNNGKNRVEIQAAMCMGCGSCAAECPARAIQLQHFTDTQILAAVKALLEVVN
ncbi:MAG: FAD-dependent oxidoreductase [Armatimonadetes bacterium]|nr:FAD-dependent oxidoreductase [Armatimonadota bacterium]